MRTESGPSLAKNLGLIKFSRTCEQSTELLQEHPQIDDTRRKWKSFGKNRHSPLSNPSGAAKERMAVPQDSVSRLAACDCSDKRLSTSNGQRGDGEDDDSPLPMSPPQYTERL